MRHNQVIQVCLVVMAAFVPAALILPRLYLFDLINALTTALGIAILIAFWPGITELVYRMRCPDKIEPGHYLVLGLSIITTIWVFRTDWIAIWRALDEPDRGLDHIVFAAAAWCLFPGAIMLLLSPKLLEGAVPRHGWRSFRTAIVISVVLFIGLAGWRWAHS